MNSPELAPPPLQLPPPELSLHRDHCLALLHRYFTLSVEVGRLPALLGREVFRTRARSYRITTFEDVIIFVHDVERCLARLAQFDQELITRIVFQEYTQEEAAALMGCCARTIERHFPEALDLLTEIFLANGILKPNTRQYRHLVLEEKPVTGKVDLNGCACESDENAHSGPDLAHLLLVPGKLVKPPFFAFCS